MGIDTATTTWLLPICLWGHGDQPLDATECIALLDGLNTANVQQVVFYPPCDVLIGDLHGLPETARGDGTSLRGLWMRDPVTIVVTLSQPLGL